MEAVVEGHAVGGGSGDAELAGTNEPVHVLARPAERLVEEPDRVEDGAPEERAAQKRRRPRLAARGEAAIGRLGRGGRVQDLRGAGDEVGGRRAIEELQLRLELVLRPDVVGVEEGQDLAARGADARVPCGGRPAVLLAEEPDAVVRKGGDPCRDSSVEPSSTTSTSRGGAVCRSAEAIASAMIQPVLNAGMTTLVRGARLMRCPPRLAAPPRRGR